MRILHAPALLGLLATLVLAASMLAAPSRAQTPYTDEELVDGFLFTVFGAEVGDAPGDVEAANVVKKFVGPVSYHILGVTEGPWATTVRAFLASLTASIEGLTLAEAPTPGAAEVVVHLVERVDYVATIRERVWAGVDTHFLEDNACSAVIAARRTGIERAFIFLVVDEGFVPFAHCMVEEIAQSLGPANDSDALPASIFNDASSVNVFGVFDWFILTMLYDARIEPGMSAGEVEPLLPAVIATARTRLPEVMAARPALPTHDSLVSAP